MEDIKVYNYGILGLEVHKNNHRYQASIPGGVPWDEAAEAMDHFRLTLLDLKKRALEQEAAAAAKVKEEQEAEVIESASSFNILMEKPVEQAQEL